MILEISIMTLSVAAMIFLLIYKYLETKRGTNIFLTKIKQKTDPVLRDIHITIERIFTMLTLHNIILLTNNLLVIVVRFFMHVSHKIHKTSADIVEKASKKRDDLTRAGASSFYLKQIKESKKQFKKLEIKEIKTEDKTGNSEQKM